MACVNGDWQRNRSNRYNPYARIVADRSTDRPDEEKNGSRRTERVGLPFPGSFSGHGSPISFGGRQRRFVPLTPRTSTPTQSQSLNQQQNPTPPLPSQRTESSSALPINRPPSPSTEPGKSDEERKPSVKESADKNSLSLIEQMRGLTVTETVQQESQQESGSGDSLIDQMSDLTVRDTPQQKKTEKEGGSSL